MFEHCDKCYPKGCHCPMTTRQKIDGIKSALEDYKNILTEGEKQQLNIELTGLQRGAGII